MNITPVTTDSCEAGDPPPQSGWSAARRDALREAEDAQVEESDVPAISARPQKWIDSLIGHTQR